MDITEYAEVFKVFFEAVKASSVPSVAIIFPDQVVSLATENVSLKLQIKENERQIRIHQEDHGAIYRLNDELQERRRHIATLEKKLSQLEQKHEKLQKAYQAEKDKNKAKINAEKTETTELAER